MKIAFVGKGGSGKSTLSSLFIRYLATQPDVTSLVGLDTDFNQHLSLLLGAPESVVADKMLGDPENMTKLKDMLRGTNPRIASAAEMVKTTPPGAGSRLHRLTPDNPVVSEFAHDVNGIKLFLTGGLRQDGIGVNCYHAYNGWAELLLAHTIDATHEYAVCDATAGTDPLSSGLFTRFDVTFLVAEPTLQGVSVFKQYAEHAKAHNVKVLVIGNKVEDADDEAFLREHVGEALFASIGVSPFVRAMKKGRHLPFSELEPATESVLAAMKAAAEATPRDWTKYQQKIETLHRKNAERWDGDAALKHIDPDFSLAAVANSLL